MNKKLLLLSGLLNADSARDREAQYALLKAMAESGGAPLDRDSFSLLVEDSLPGRTLSVRRAARLLEAGGAFRQEGGSWVYEPLFPGDGQRLDWADFVALFEEKPAAQGMPIASGAPAREAILRAVAWMVDMTLYALRSGQTEGQPAFYTCEEDGDRPIGFKVAGTATSDSLSMLCQSLDYLPACGRSGEEIAACIAFLLEKTLACRCTAEGWDHGGFYPLEDQPDSEHPTVDASCLAVMALCAFLEKKPALETALSTAFSCKEDEIMLAVLDGLDFLLRMQGEDGSFGIYRYESGLSAQANENCTRIAMSTMGVCKGSGIFDRLGREELYPMCSGVIARAYVCLVSRAAVSDAGALWAPFFGERTEDFPPADVLVSSARVCRAWIPVWWQMEQERPSLLASFGPLLTYWERNAEQAERVGYYRFTSPSAEQFSRGEYFWASHPDMLTAFSVLQAYNLFDLPLTKQHWALIERAVGRTLRLQHPHGHWDNPLAKKTPFCAVTLAAIELLQEYRKAKDLTQ